MLLPKTIRIGTRASRLAVVQALEVKNRLLGAIPSLKQEQIEIVKITTTGDQIQDRSLVDIGGKGLFTKEIEEQLFSGNIDIAVHSMKDMPDIYPDGLAINCILEREDPRDAYLHPQHIALDDLPAGSRIGSCAIRRIVQLQARYPHLEMVPIRGNVLTRLRKMKAGEVDGLLLAYAGLKRLERVDTITQILPPTWMLPAIAQGAIGVECISKNQAMHTLLAHIDHPASRLQVKAERGFLKAISGTCATPMGAHSILMENGDLQLTAMLADAKGTHITTRHHTKMVQNDDEARTLGMALGREIVQQHAARNI